MKTLLSILGSLTIAGSGVAPLAGTTTQSAKANSGHTNKIQGINQRLITSRPEEVNIINNNFVGEKSDLFNHGHDIQNEIEKQFNISQFLEHYLTNHPDSELEYDLLNSLSLVNQNIQINFDLLENYKNDFTLYQTLISDDFVTNLNELYNEGILTYNTDYHFFSFADEKFQIESKGNNFFWVETHWYWFGYHKTHLCHELSEIAADQIELTGDNIDIIYDQISLVIEGSYPQFAGLVKSIMATIKVVCLVNSSMFKKFDHGKGVWVGSFWGIPGIGCGSNK